MKTTSFSWNVRGVLHRSYCRLMCDSSPCSAEAKCSRFHQLLPLGTSGLRGLIRSRLQRVFSLPPVSSLLGFSLRIAIAFFITHLGFHTLYLASAYQKEQRCKGWECERVYCPKGYAVYVPEQNAYLPCDQFEAFAEFEDTSVLMKAKGGVK